MSGDQKVPSQSAWILLSGCVLAFLAAAVNADFMIRLGVSVSHLTGDLSRITVESIQAGDSWIRNASLLCTSIVGFITGAALSGFVIHHPRFERHRPYAHCLAGVGTLLILASFVSPQSPVVGCGMAAMACGLQNALATRYRGIVIRTTHITGLLTDVGQFLGMRLGGHHVETWKISTPLLIALAFAIGAGVGAWVSVSTSLEVTFFAGLIYCGGSTFLGIWRIAASSTP